MSTPAAVSDRRAVLRRRVRLLVAATITYNVVEAIVAISAGTVAGSIALIGFGLDSVIEVSSAAAVAWQFTGPDPEHRERITLRVIAGSFFALAAFVTVEALRTLIAGDEPGRSTVGIALVTLSVVVMPALSLAQRRAGRELGSASAVADSRQTLLCTYLSAGVLVGLLLNATLGWWWADPAVALALAVVAVREGRAALRGDTCCSPLLLDDVRTAWVPASCTLPKAEQPLRVAEFDDLFAAAVGPTQRLGPTRLRLHLPGGDAVAEQVRELIGREAECCSFFTFELRPSAALTELDVSVPAAQAPILSAIGQRVDAARAKPGSPGGRSYESG